MSYKWKESIGITWDSSGCCRAVRLIRLSDGMVNVADFWLGDEAETGRSVPESLRLACEKLGNNSQIRVVAGGLNCGAVAVDVEVPALSRAQLREMLEYELRRQIPIDESRLVWGYRLLDSGGVNTKNMVRYLAMRREDWLDWLDKVSLIEGGVDAVLSPEMTADPLFANRPVLFSGRRTEDERIFYVPDEQGLREPVLARATDSLELDCFGFGNEPLKDNRLQLGMLDRLSGDEQSEFAGSLALAWYGLCDCLSRDIKTLPELPRSLRPRRHRRQRRIVTVFAVYILAALTFFGGRNIIWNRNALEQLDEQLHKSRVAIEQLEEERDPTEELSLLAGEIKDLRLQTPRLLECLLELTKALDVEYWVSNFNWNSGNMKVEVRTSVDDLSFVENLESSAIFAGVVPTRKVVDHRNNLAIQLELHSTTAETSPSSLASPESSGTDAENAETNK